MLLSRWDADSFWHWSLHWGRWLWLQTALPCFCSTSQERSLQTAVKPTKNRTGKGYGKKLVYTCTQVDEISVKGIEWLRLDASVDFGWKPRFLINYKCYFDSKLKYYKRKNNEILQVGYCKSGCGNCSVLPVFWNCTVVHIMLHWPTVHVVFWLIF